MQKNFNLIDVIYCYLLIQSNSSQWTPGDGIEDKKITSSFLPSPEKQSNTIDGEISNNASTNNDSRSVIRFGAHTENNVSRNTTAPTIVQSYNQNLSATNKNPFDIPAADNRNFDLLNSKPNDLLSWLDEKTEDLVEVCSDNIKQEDTTDGIEDEIDTLPFQNSSKELTR